MGYKFSYKQNEILNAVLFPFPFFIKKERALASFFALNATKHIHVLTLSTMENLIVL